MSEGARPVPLAGASHPCRRVPSAAVIQISRGTETASFERLLTILWRDVLSNTHYWFVVLLPVLAIHGRRINARVVGLSSDDSETLLDVLWEHAMQEQFTWKQEWQVGDLVWWDNRCAMHRRDSFDPTTRRLLHRTQLRGLRPC